MNHWIESLHPRDGHGRFAHKSEVAKALLRAAESVHDEDPSGLKTFRVYTRARLLKNRRATGWASGKHEEFGSGAHVAHLARITKILNDPANDHYDTQKTYAVNVDGDWRYTMARKKMQDEIINTILANTKAKADRKAILSGGLGGSGKGSILRMKGLKDNPDYLTLDPDEIKVMMVDRGMAPVVDGLTPLETAKYMHEESGDIFARVFAAARAKGLNIIVDRTMGSKSAIRDAQFLKNSGYSVRAFFSDVPVDVSVERALQRHLRGANEYFAGENPRGGRFVPASYIRSAAEGAPAGMNSKNRGIFEQLVSSGLLDASELYDNTGKNPIRVASVGQWD